VKNTKLAGVAGICWAVLNVSVGMAAGQPPEIGAPAEDIRTYLDDHHSLMLAAAFLFAVTLPALFTFFGALLGRRGTDNAAPIAGGASAALALFVASFSLAYLLVLPLVLEDSLRVTASDALVSYLWTASFLMTMMGNIGFGIVLLGVAATPAAAPRRSRASGAIIGVAAIVTSAIGVVSTDVMVAAGLAFVVLAIWMIVVGVGMVRNEQKAAVGTLAPAGI